MMRKLPLLALALILAASLLPQARAQGDQSVVIGLGIGPFVFSKSDDFRAADPPAQLEEIPEATYTQAYIEWYALDQVGFGLRYIQEYVFRTDITAFFSVDREIDVRNILLTANWVPFSWQEYTQLGFLAGLGTSKYEYTYGTTFIPAVTGSASGTALLLGTFLDWGAEDFGGRVGINMISTDLEKLNGATVDGSGTALYIDMRWAFD